MLWSLLAKAWHNISRKPDFRNIYVIKQLKTTLLLAILLLSGCARTLIPVVQPHEGTTRLAALLDRELTVSIPDPPQDYDRYVGHQYGLIFFPLGRISVSRPELSLLNAVYEAGAVHGVRVTTSPSKSKLTISNLEINLTAYDFFVTRRVSIEVRIEASYESPSGVSQKLSIRSSKSEFKRFPFQATTTAIFERAIRDGAEQLITRILGL